MFQQQGRVLLDADWNEQAQIQLHLLRTLARDLLGPCWAAGGGFALTTSTTDAKGTVKPLPLTDWQLAPGHFYVDGILCENDSVCTLAAQPYAPTPDYGVADGRSGFENPPDGFALWLDVWERHLSAVEAPSLDDVALGGIDTCSRAEVVWQLRLIDQVHAEQQLDDVTGALNVRLAASTDTAAKAAIKKQIGEVDALRASLGDGGANRNDDPCTLVGQLLDARDRYAGPRMRAQLAPAESDSDPCVIAADARYRGCENQLYRVEIHQGGLAGSADAPGPACFKWSRENGSVVFAVAAWLPAPRPTTAAANWAWCWRGWVATPALAWRSTTGSNWQDDDYTLAQRAIPVAAGDRDRQRELPRHAGRAEGRDALSAVRRPAQASAAASMGPGGGRRRTRLHGLVEGSRSRWKTASRSASSRVACMPHGDYWLIPARVAGNGLLDWPMATRRTAAERACRCRREAAIIYAVLGLTGDNDAFKECCCRFGSLCDLIRPPAKRQTGDARLVLRPPPRRATSKATERRAAKKQAAARQAAPKSRASRCGNTHGERIVAAVTVRIAGWRVRRLRDGAANQAAGERRQVTMP